MHQSHQERHPSQPATNHSHQFSEHAASNNADQPNPLALLAQALEPFAVQGPSHSPHSARSGMGEQLHNIPTGASGSSASVRQAFENAQESGSYGTLMLSKRGRSKYLGPTAGSEWLKESEMQDVSDSPLMTRAPSPERPHDSIPSQPSHLTPHTAPIGFPLNASPAHISTRELLSCLPPRDEAWTLAESYYRYCAWQ